jgi:hypothetical protein
VPLEVLKVHTCTELLVAPAGEQIRSQVVVVALRVQQHTCLARPFSGLSGTRPSLAATQSIKCIVLPIRGVVTRRINRDTERLDLYIDLR